MTLESILEQIEKNNDLIAERLNQNKELANQIRNLSDEEMDWIPVSVACKIWSISPAKMYQKINSGKIKARKFDSKTYVSKSEILEINDKVV